MQHLVLPESKGVHKKIVGPYQNNTWATFTLKGIYLIKSKTTWTSKQMVAVSDYDPMIEKETDESIQIINKWEQINNKWIMQTYIEK